MRSTNHSVRSSFARALILALLCVSAIAWLTGCSRQGSAKATATQDPAVPITTAGVELVPLDRSLAVVGTLSPMDEATVAAQVEGLVEKTLVDFGATVTNSMDLALVDTASYEALAQQAAANVARAKASALNAEQNLKRTRELQASKISAISELDAATAQSEQTRAEVRSAEATEAIALLNLARSRVKAPFAGGVSERFVSAGDYVKIGTPMFKLVNDLDLKLLTQAPEKYASEIKLGQTLTFTVDAYPGRLFEGKVFRISPSVNTATRSFTLGARVTNADRALKASTFARGAIVLASGIPTRVVPLDAVLNFSGITKVFVIEGGSAHAREVRVGRVQNGRQEILDGLKEGEIVAITGVTKLYDKAPVRVIQHSPAGAPDSIEPARTPIPAQGATHAS